MPSAVMIWSKAQHFTFKAAIAENADALECDIHVSSEGTAMVIHGDKIGSYCEITEDSLPGVSGKAGEK